MATTADLPASWRRNLLTNMHGNGAVSLDYESQDARNTLSWWGPATDWKAFKLACLYKTETITFPGGSLTRTVPLVSPFDTDLSALAVRFRPLSIPKKGEQNATDPWAAGAPFPWPKMVATVTFGPLPYNTGAEEGAFIEVRERSTSSRITIPNHAYQLIDDSSVFVERVAQDISIRDGVTLIDIIYQEIANLPPAIAFVDPYIDTVNSDTVTLPLLGLVCQPGTLHVQSRDSGVTVKFGGSRKARLSMTAAYRRRGHNRAVASKSPHAGTFLRVDPRPIPEIAQAPLFRGY